MRITFSTLLLITTQAITFGQGKSMVQGQVKLSDGSPMRNAPVYLLQYDPASKAISLIDSAYTDASGKYSFSGARQYLILARPDEATSQDLPTYFGNSLFSSKATPVSVEGSGPVTADLTTSKKGSLAPGNGSLGGIIELGKNIGPAVKINVFLADKDKNPVAVTSTNSRGEFRFSKLGNGIYYIWADLAGLDNTSADPITVNTLNPNKDKLKFQVDDGALVWMDNYYNSIKEALASKETVYQLNLNSLQHDVAEKSLVIAPDGNRMLGLQIGEFTNLEMLSADINMINFLPKEIGKLVKLMSLSLSLNKLTSLPVEFSNLKNLRTLNLGKNAFAAIPDVVLALSGLETLNFEGNPITVVPAGINSMKGLKELSFSGCGELTALPPQIGELANLETLDLSNCTKLKSIPKELANLKNLKVLDVTGTKINVSAFKKAVPGCEIRMSDK